MRRLGEDVWGSGEAVRRAPLRAAERRECYRDLGQWLARRARPGAGERVEDRATVPVATSDELTRAVQTIVAGRDGRAS